MTEDNNKNIKEDNTIDNSIEDFNELNDEITDLDSIENEEELIEENTKDDEKCNDILTRTLSDFENFKMRSERDKQDMIFFIKSDILNKILPRLDDIERIIKNTTDEEKKSTIYEGLLGLEKKLVKDLDLLGVKYFDSIGEKVNPDYHEVMTQIPGGEEGIIIDEFEKGYTLNGKVLRVAKVIVGQG